MTNIPRIFVGCAANGEDAESQAVLEWSLRKHASGPINLIWMKLSRDPENFYYGLEGGWNTSSWATPFSGFRWSIPAYCNYEGQAIYCDSDFIFMDDIYKLWNQVFAPGKVLMAKGGPDSWRYCLCKWNCQLAKTILPPIEDLKKYQSTHSTMIHFFATHPDLTQRFEGNWNCIDGEDYNDLNDPNIKAIHYSDMSSQVHLKYAIPRLEQHGQKHWFDGTVRRHWRTDLQTLFDDYLMQANEDGYYVESYIPKEPFGPYNKESQHLMGNKIIAHQWSR